MAPPYQHPCLLPISVSVLHSLSREDHSASARNHHHNHKSRHNSRLASVVTQTATRLSTSVETHRVMGRLEQEVLVAVLRVLRASTSILAEHNKGSLLLLHPSHLVRLSQQASLLSLQLLSTSDKVNSRLPLHLFRLAQLSQTDRHHLADSTSVERQHRLLPHRHL